VELSDDQNENEEESLKKESDVEQKKKTVGSPKLAAMLKNKLNK